MPHLRLVLCGTSSKADPKKNKCCSQMKRALKCGDIVLYQHEIYHRLCIKKTAWRLRLDHDDFNIPLFDNSYKLR